MSVLRVSRQQRRREIESKIGRRKLVWFGTRGSDAQSLLDYPQFTDCFSLVAPLRSLVLRNEESLETIRQHRVDLNAYNTDADTSEEARRLHRALMRTCDAPCVLTTYRPSGFLASVCYPRINSVQYAGMFHERLAAFEHKTWVETQLRRAGVNVVPWQYVADEEISVIAEAVARGAHVLRANRSSGGAGVQLIRTLDELATHWPAHRDGFLAVAPYLEGNVPLNVNACLFPDGSVTLHAPSFQLIGLRACTGRTFGYCGNDFARVRDLDVKVLDALEDLVLQAGRWLHKERYVGVFGVDALLHNGRIYLAEINARFQGSSAVAADLAVQMDLPDLFADQLAAFLDLDAPPPIRLRDLAREQPPVSQVICYNRSVYPVRRRTDELLDRVPLKPQLLPTSDIDVAPEGMLFKVVPSGAVTNDGQSLHPLTESAIESLIAEQFVSGPGSDRN